jgi:hypothetical protein
VWSLLPVFTHEQFNDRKEKVPGYKVR